MATDLTAPKARYRSDDQLITDWVKHVRPQEGRMPSRSTPN